MLICDHIRIDGSSRELIVNKSSVFHRREEEAQVFRFKISFMTCCLITIFALYNIWCKFRLSCRLFSLVNCMLMLMLSILAQGVGDGGTTQAVQISLFLNTVHFSENLLPHLVGL